jgi:hypothetical protein
MQHRPPPWGDRQPVALVHLTGRAQEPAILAWRHIRACFKGNRLGLTAIHHDDDDLLSVASLKHQDVLIGVQCTAFPLGDRRALAA